MLPCQPTLLCELIGEGGRPAGTATALTEVAKSAPYLAVSPWRGKGLRAGSGETNSIAAGNRGASSLGSDLETRGGTGQQGRDEELADGSVLHDG